MQQANATVRAIDKDDIERLKALLRARIDLLDNKAGVAQKAIDDLRQELIRAKARPMA